MSKMTSADWMKIQNTRSILKTIHEEEGIYRKLVAQKTNLASQTVTNIVTELISRKVVREDTIQQSGKGRTPVSLSINYRAFYMLSVFISVQKIVVILNSLDGKAVLAREEEIQKGAAVLPLLKEILQEILLKNGSNTIPQAIAVSVEGIVNEEEGIVIEAKDISWNHVPLKEELAFLNMPVFVRNDVNQIAYYEKNMHQDDINFMVLKLDRGVGSSLVIDRHILKSTNSVAGEIGHVTVGESNERRKCQCGKYNCLTQFISKSALQDRYGKSYAELKRDVENKITEAIQMIEEVCDLLAPILANLIILLDLDRIILTGCIIEDFEQIIYPRLDRKIRDNLSYWVAFKTLEIHKQIEPAQIGAQFLIESYFSNTSELLFLWDV